MATPSFTFIPALGNCCVIIFVPSFSSISSIDIFKFTSFNLFFASSIVSPSIFGTSISFFIFSSFILSFCASKYGNTSAKTFPPIGAATAPPWCPPSPVGLYKVTSITTSGFVVGPTPINEVTYLFVFTPSSEVPVFPPMLYPSTCAFLPVPSSTTDCIILNTFLAVSFDITLSCFSTGISVTSPV